MLRYPLEKIAARIADDLCSTSKDDMAGSGREFARRPSCFAHVNIQNPVRSIDEQPLPETPLVSGYWTLLQEVYRQEIGALGRQIVMDGPETALHDVPLGQFGKLLTIDRREIESLRSIRSLVAEYSRQRQLNRPLSIAVFGFPGSGKSFGIKEIASSLLPGQIDVKEFNLSQFSDEADLLSSLHQVRDVSLSGKLPLVFWDEFDTSLLGQPLGWLRHFLAPMQDGAFQEGQIVHPIGRCIFVFAGGTCHALEQFGKGISPEAYRAAKVPDFVSRLKGYVNILGPNRTSPQDSYFALRRAILLRSILSIRVPQIFESGDGKGRLNIDQGVLRALLATSEYRHGARSIESLIAMSQLTGKTSFERSSLPSETQLDLHVHGREFLALVQKLELEGEILEKMAIAAHEFYCSQQTQKGFVYGPCDDTEQKISSRIVSYAELPDQLKAQNREFVRDIPDKLARAGYIMTPARSDEPPFSFPGEDLELLAEQEHNRWLQAKLAPGWRYGPENDPIAKTNPCLLPWRNLSDNELRGLFGENALDFIGRELLPDEEKEKDRELVRAIPLIVEKAGYAILKLEPR